MNIEKKYKVIGKDNAEAKFIVSPTGFLQIEFAGTLCRMRAPFSKLTFEAHNSLALQNAVEINYSSGMSSEVFWQVTVSQHDGEELKSIIQEAAEALQKFLSE